MSAPSAHRASTVSFHGNQRESSSSALLGALLGSALLLASACAPARPPELHQVDLQGEAFGTTWTVKLVKESPLPDDVVSEIRNRITAELESIDRTMSTYRDDSELMRINQGTPAASRLSVAPPGQRFAISDSLAEVLQIAVAVQQASAGAFDVTVGPLVDLWGFGRSRPASRQPPSDEALARARDALGGSQLLQIERGDDGGWLLTKPSAQAEIDLSAIAKGYAVDRVDSLLASSGYANSLVEIGGEIVVRGVNRQGTRWVLAVERPTATGRAIHRLLRPEAPVAMATSGDYRNFYEHEGRRYSHTIDPRTAAPVAHHGASVSVLADSCALADAWATALLVLGPERGPAVAEQEGIAAWFLSYGDRPGELLEHATTAFDRRLAAGNEQEETHEPGP